MIYEVRHATTYTYPSPVPAARWALRLLPRDEPRQRVLAASLEVSPAPAERSERRDAFGNPLTSVRLAGAHRVVDFRTRLRVEVAADDPPLPSLSPSVRTVAAEALRSRSLDAGAPAHHLAPSRHVPALDEAHDYAAPSLAPTRPALEGAIELMGRIRADFAYDPAATTVSTPLWRVASERRGVCQDFAHWMCAGLRAHGLPAAYVSGYLRTRPPPGRPRLVGADASHAWVRLWCGGGLPPIDLDPTNDVVCGADHVVLAVGRDYADVAPVAGVAVQSGGHRLKVGVDVVPLAEGT